MILAAGDVVDLQFFLMDAAKRYVDTGGAVAAEDDVLASAAALDYALWVSSEHASEPIDDGAPVAQTVRTTMTRASVAALDLVDRVLCASDELFADFVGRHLHTGGIFDVLRSLRNRDVVPGSDVAFRVLTATNDIAERRRRRGP
ncbi:MAG: hypothetical protein NVSMB19_05940 [Vulcanimicrobiaceae bacterium]